MYETKVSGCAQGLPSTSMISPQAALQPHRDAVAAIREDLSNPPNIYFAKAELRADNAVHKLGSLGCTIDEIGPWRRLGSGENFPAETLNKGNWGLVSRGRATELDQDAHKFSS